MFEVPLLGHYERVLPHPASHLLGRVPISGALMCAHMSNGLAEHPIDALPIAATGSLVLFL